MRQARSNTLKSLSCFFSSESWINTSEVCPFTLVSIWPSFFHTMENLHSLTFCWTMTPFASRTTVRLGGIRACPPVAAWVRTERSRWQGQSPQKRVISFGCAPKCSRTSPGRLAANMFSRSNREEFRYLPDAARHRPSEAIFIPTWGSVL